MFFRLSTPIFPRSAAGNRQNTSSRIPDRAKKKKTVNTSGQRFRFRKSINYSEGRNKYAGA